ncbi:MAG: hypothetical protein ACJAT2_002923 [Bacteriovoracaceae bacterium]|jgi:hypothetical protein
MNFQLAYIKNSQQIVLKDFGENQTQSKGKIMDIDELPKLNLQGLFLPEELLQDTEFLGTLNSTTEVNPIRTAEEFGLDLDNFEALSTESATPYFKKVYESWILQNNLSLLEEMTNIYKHLNSLWANERTAFFEELWNLLKRNLGTSELTIVYNDVKKAKKEGEKNKLIRVKVHGKLKANPEEGGELEANLMKNYENLFSPSFEVVEFNKEKGQLVALCTIKKSPVIIMANVYGLTRLQKTILKTLVDGLQENWV